ncbi:hypothetical protein BBP40_002926 [Aspergillus hancockii]|nr:hypothetical protein BBP40_002926 [Aspergillus hancockii]
MVDASKAIETLIKDEEKFLATYPIASHNLFPVGTPVPPNKQGYIKLIGRPENKAYEVQATKFPSVNTRPSYVLDFKSRPSQGDAPVYVDITKTVKDKDIQLLFTVELSGCSVVVTEPDPKSGKYRVFHDSRPLASVLHDKVVMAIDMPDYLFSLDVFTNEILATTWLQYNFGAKEWRLHAQLLVSKGDKAQFREFRPAKSVILPNHFSRRPGQYTKPDIKALRKKLLEEMEKLIGTINADMKHLSPSWPTFAVPRDQDGAFRNFNHEPNATVETNPAVARTRALRKTLDEIEKELKKFFGNDAPIRKSFPTIYSARDRSMTIDITYLWWLKKASHH